MKAPEFLIPVQARFEADRVFFRWLDAGRENFDEPFFDQTITTLRIAAHAEGEKFQETDETALDERAPQWPYADPSAIVFHVSRCGSTLLAQMFLQQPENIVLAEVPVFDQVLRMPLSQSRKIELLKKIFPFYAQPRDTPKKYWIVKADSWHLFDAAIYRELFPETPFLFLYREPAAVLRSHQNQPGMQMVPGQVNPAVFGISEDDFLADIPGYPALVMRHYYRRMLELAQTDNHAMLLSYDAGLLNQFPAVLKLMRKTISENDWQRIRERTQYHSKKPGEKFAERAETEVRVPEETLQAYAALESFRLKGVSAD